MFGVLSLITSSCIMADLLLPVRTPDKNICLDPDWASSTKGLFICITCSGIHRNLGSDVSVVKSLRLDTWTDIKLEVR